MSRSPMIDICPATRHGTAVDYNARGCRCPDARALASAQRLQRHHANRPMSTSDLVDAFGATRRLRALACNGWGLLDLAEYTAVNRDVLSRHRAGTHAQISRHLHTVITMTYDRLSGQTGPTARATQQADRDGWLPPAAWLGVNIDDPNAQPDIDTAPDVDEVAVERYVNGDHDINLNRDEKIAAAELMARRGVGQAEIENVLRIGWRTVLSHRSAAA